MSTTPLYTTVYGVLNHRKQGVVIKVTDTGVYIFDTTLGVLQGKALQIGTQVAFSSLCELEEYGNNVLIFSSIGMFLLVLDEYVSNSGWYYFRKVNQASPDVKITDIIENDSAFTVDAPGVPTTAEQVVQSSGYANVDEQQQYDVYAYKTYYGNKVFSTPESVLFNPGAPEGRTWVDTGGTIGGLPITCFATSGASVFAGTAKNGVYASQDNGKTWTSVNTGLSNLNVTCMTADSGTLYAGTENGAYSSNDTIVAWSNILNSKSIVDGKAGVMSTAPISNINYLNGNLFIVTVRDSYAALIYSDDGGVTWSYSINGNVQTSANMIINGTFDTDLTGWSGGTNWVWAANGAVHHTGATVALTPSVAPLVAGKTYQCTFDVKGMTAGFVDLDDGSGSINYLAVTGNGSYSISIYPIGTDINIQFVPSSTFDGTIDNVSAIEETPVAEVLDIVYNGTSFLVSTKSTGGTPTCILWSSTDRLVWTLKITESGPMYTATRLFYDGTYLYAATGLGARRTSNYTSWTTITVGMGVVTISDFNTYDNNLIAAASSGTFYSINHGTNWVSSNSYNSTSIIKSGNNYIAGTVGGVFSSTDLSTWNASNTGLSNSIVQCMLDTTSGLYCGTQLGVFVSQDNGGTWTSLPAITGNNNVIGLAVISSLLYAVTPYSVYSFSTTWTDTGIGATLSGDTILCSVRSSTSLAIGTAATSVWAYGGSWVHLTAGTLSATAGIKSIYADINHNLYAGLTTGGVYYYDAVSTHSWAVLSGFTSTLIANDFYFAPMSVTMTGYTTLMIATNSGVYWSIDGGTTFTQANAGFTSLKINHLAVVGKNVYASADNGVYVSLVNYSENAPTWSAVSTGLTNGNIIFLLSVTSGLFAATSNGEIFFLANADATNLFSVNVAWAISGSTPDGYLVVFKGFTRGTQWFDITDPSVYLVGGNIVLPDDGTTIIWNANSIIAIPDTSVTAYGNVWGYRYIYSAIQRKSIGDGSDVWDRAYAGLLPQAYESAANMPVGNIDYGSTFFNTPIAAGNVCVSGVYTTPTGQYDITNFGIYRTKNLGANSKPPGTGLSPDSSGNNSELYIWTKDIPVAKAFNVLFDSTPSLVITANNGTFKIEDIGNVLKFANGQTATIVAVDEIANTATLDGLAGGTSNLETTCCLGGGRLAVALRNSDGTIAHSSGDVFNAADVGRPLFWADGEITWVQSSYTLDTTLDLVSASPLTALEIPMPVTMYPVAGTLSRVFNDTTPDVGATTGEVGLTERFYSGSRKYFPKRGYLPFPNLETGLYGFGFVVGAIRGDKELYYADVASTLYSPAIYRPITQQEYLDTEIQAFFKFGSTIAIFGSGKTRSITPVSATDVGNASTEESVYVIPSSALIDDSIGVKIWQSIQSIGQGLIVAVTSEPAFRTFDGTSWNTTNYADTQVQNLLQQIRNDISGQRIVSSYTHGRYSGYKIWFPTGETNPETTCLRFATQPTEGQGWSLFNGSGFVRPIIVYKILDANENIRLIAEDGIGIYEIDTFDSITDTKPPFLDKIDIDGTGGTEIAGEAISQEFTAGAGQEEERIKDVMSWVQVRPQDLINRRATGYNAAGMKNSQAFGMKVFADSEQVNPEAETVNIPDFGDVVFPGYPNIEAHRLQYSITFMASEFRIVEIKHRILAKQQIGSTAQGKMTESGYQNSMASGLALYMTRSNPLFDRVTKQVVTPT